jgi:hypothetical protein
MSRKERKHVRQGEWRDSVRKVSHWYCGFPDSSPLKLFFGQLFTLFLRIYCFFTSSVNDR